MTTSDLDNNGEELKTINLAAREDRRLAKYCNFVTFTSVEGNIIMDFIARDVGMFLKSEDGKNIDQGVLIERIIVDREHARKIADKLNEVLLKSANAK